MKHKQMESQGQFYAMRPYLPYIISVGSTCGLTGVLGLNMSVSSEEVIINSELIITII